MDIHADYSLKPPKLMTHRVYLNEELQTDVIFARDTDGLVARIRRDVNGMLMYAGGEFQVDVLRGTVRIEEIPAAASPVVATPITGGEGPPPPPAGF